MCNEAELVMDLYFQDVGLIWNLLVSPRLSAPYALLIIPKSSNSKNQVVHEQKIV